MKTTGFTIILMLLLSCSKPSGRSEKTAVDTLTKLTSSIPADKIQTVEPSDVSDTGSTNPDHVDTVTYTAEYLKQVLTLYPVFTDDLTLDPDETYQTIQKQHDESPGISFISEVGKDDFYQLYAYFLKKKNGDKKFTKRRHQLIKLYENINIIFQALEYGGTYFGHMESRIPAYVEYSIYLYSSKEGNFEKTYNIAQQKKLYIQSLRQLIADECAVDAQTAENKKDSRKEALNKIVNSIETSITDIFYLRRVQEFHYYTYEYW